MPKYQFTIVRVVEEFNTYEVEADTEAEARDIAQNLLDGETELESTAYDERCTDTHIEDDSMCLVSNRATLAQG